MAEPAIVHDRVRVVYPRYANNHRYAAEVILVNMLGLDTQWIPVDSGDRLTLSTSERHFSTPVCSVEGHSSRAASRWAPVRVRLPTPCSEHGAGGEASPSTFVPAYCVDRESAVGETTELGFDVFLAAFH